MILVGYQRSPVSAHRTCSQLPAAAGGKPLGMELPLTAEIELALGAAIEASVDLDLPFVPWAGRNMLDSDSDQHSGSMNALPAVAIAVVAAAVVVVAAAAAVASAAVRVAVHRMSVYRAACPHSWCY